MDRMKDEPVFLALASKSSDYLGGRGEVKAQAKIALRRVEHFYYKTNTVYGAMRRMTIAQQEAQQQAAPTVQARPQDIQYSLIMGNPLKGTFSRITIQHLSKKDCSIRGNLRTKNTTRGTLFLATEVF